MRWPFVSRATSEQQSRSFHDVLAKLGAVGGRLDAALAENAALRERAALLLDQRDEYRRLHEAERARSAETLQRFLDLAAPAPTRPEPPHAPVPEEERALRAVADETVDRMAEAFTRDGMPREAALAHARELAAAAERQYWGA